MKDPDFISVLEEQAKLQSKLHKQRLLPKNVDWITSVVGNYPWQFILVLSIIGALFWQFFLG